MIKDGIYTNISNEQYNEINAIRSSFIKTVLDNPRLAWFEKMNILPKEQTTSMLFGTLVHEAILEPEKYNARVIAGNQSKTDKEIPADKKISASNKEKIDAIIKMWNFCSKRKMINGALKELTVVSNGKKCRIDFLKQNTQDDSHVLIGDIKTVSRIDISGLNYAISDYKYILQLAYYRKIFEEAVERFKKGEIHSDIDFSKVTYISTMLVFIHTSPPFSMRYLELDDYVENKYNDIDTALNIIKEQENKYGYDINRPWDTNIVEDIEKDQGGFTIF